MAQWVKSPAAKSAEPSLILETHRVEKRPDSDPHKLSSDRSPPQHTLTCKLCGEYMPTHPQIHTYRNDSINVKNI